MEVGLRWGEGHAGVQVPERVRKSGLVSGPGTSRAPANARLSWPVPGGRDAGCVREGKEKG